MSEPLASSLASRFEGTAGYVCSPELMDVVQVAMILEKPLLIRGEPGTGKTLLAQAIAEALGRPLWRWQIKSTSRAADGLYVYDTIQRLNDSRFGEGQVAEIGRYIKPGPLGQAFASPQPSVVLIDEIDKADPEFPNDLLHELDAMAFDIVETGEQVRAVHRPVVIITSNAEKELPDAFLRRCIFHYIAFPDEAMMRQIVAVHHPDLEQELLAQCLRRFYWLRDQAEVRKKPSTSELIDWISALVRSGLPAEAVAREMPFLGTLLKREADLMAIRRRL